MVTVKPTGIPDFPSSIEAIRALTSDPAFEPEFGILCDFREVRYTPPMQEIFTVGRFLSLPGVFKDHKIALIVSPGPHRTLARLLANIAAAWDGDISVFLTVEEGEAWLSG